MNFAIIGRSILLSLALGITQPVVAGEIVRAENYDAFWLWAAVQAQPALKQAKTIYLLQGEVKDRPTVRLVSQRPAIPTIQGSDVWMVIRVENLDWPPSVAPLIIRQVGRWRAAGNKVVGVQIDFDSATRHLNRYAAFLREFRQQLPPDLKLGITGLLDWSANGDPEGLLALGGTVDEIILQIYQGRRVIPGYQSYLKRIERMKTPFKIGLLQGGEWTAPASLSAHSAFQGYVVFLVNGGQ